MRIGTSRTGVRYLGRGGSGTTHVALHGLGMSVESWLPLAEVLERAGFSLLAVELPFHGESAPFDSDAFADEGCLAFAVRVVEQELLALLDEPAHRGVHLIASSYGALVAASIVARGRIRIDRLSVISSASLFADREERRRAAGGARRNLGATFDTGTLEAARQRLRNLGVRDGDGLERALPGIVKSMARPESLAYFVACVEELGELPDGTFAEALTAVDLDIVWGSHDPRSPLSIIPGALERHPHARVSVVLGGHLPYIDGPAEVARAISQVSMGSLAGATQ